MSMKKINENVFSLRAIDWNRRLFDGLIPLPDGTTYNAYLIKGSEKTALIDTVDFKKKDELIKDLKELNIEKIDYIVSNHAEQDHSGSIPTLLKLYPSAKVLTNERCKNFLKELLNINDEKFEIIVDKQEVNLGDKTLQFFITPWVHWPETMLTYLKEDEILFSCDLFGSHLALNELSIKDECKLNTTAKRYYAEIMMPFRTSIVKHLQGLENINIKIIAPSHGPIHIKPKFIIDAYKDWTSDNVTNKVLIPYISMHGSTQKMVDYLSESLSKKNILVELFDLSKTDIGNLAMEIIDSATIVVGSPTVLLGLHPVVANTVILANALKPKTKALALIGSYGWSTQIKETTTKLLTNLDAEILDVILIKGTPKEGDYKQLESLSEKIFEKHKELNLL